MELEITSEQKNPLVNRTEIKAVVTGKVSPKKSEVAKMVAEKYSVPVENLRILTIYGKYGTNDFEIAANIYDSKEEKEEVELISKKEKAQEAKVSEESEPKEAEAKAAEPAPAEEPKEKAPAEENKSKEAAEKTE